MRKTKCKFIMIAICCLTVLFGLCACKRNPGDSTSIDSSDSGSNSEQTDEIAYIWSGLADYNLKITDTAIDASGVKCMSQDGLYCDFTVDDGDVKYGEKGEYTVKFSCGNDVKSQKVTIYALPTINAQADTFRLSYDKIFDKTALDGLYGQITAKDCFENELPIAIDETTSEFFNQDGTVNYGVYDITVVAKDKTGQVATKNVKIEVVRNEEKEPVINDFNADVIDSSKAVNIDLKGNELMLVTVNGEALNADYFTIDERNENLTINVQEVDNLIIGDNSLRITTAGGYKEITLSVTDDAPAGLDIAGREESDYIVGDTVSLITPNRQFKKQIFDLSYELTDPDGQSVKMNDATTFSLTKNGVYSLKWTAKKGDINRGEVTVKYNSLKAYNSLRNDADRKNVSGYCNLFSSDETVVTALSTSYEKEISVGGKTGNYLQVYVGNDSYVGLTVPTSYTKAELEKLRDSGVMKINTSLYIDSKYDKRILQSLYSNIVSPEISVPSNVIVNPQKWTQISVNINYVIENYENIQNGKCFWFYIYNGGDGLDVHEANFKIYFTEFLFDLPREFPAYADVYGTEIDSVEKITDSTRFSGVSEYYKVDLKVRDYFAQLRTNFKGIQADKYYRIKLGFDYSVNYGYPVNLVAINGGAAGETSKVSSTNVEANKEYSFIMSGAELNDVSINGTKNLSFWVYGCENPVVYITEPILCDTLSYTDVYGAEIKKIEKINDATKFDGVSEYYKISLNKQDGNARLKVNLSGIDANKSYTIRFSVSYSINQPTYLFYTGEVSGQQDYVLLNTVEANKEYSVTLTGARILSAGLTGETHFYFYVGGTENAVLYITDPIEVK